MDHIKDILKGMHEEFSWLIWGMLGIAMFWFFSGGTSNESAHNGAFIKPLAPLDSGRTYGNYYSGTSVNKQETLNLSQAPANIVRGTEAVVESFFEKSKKAAAIHTQSVTAKGIFIDGIAGAKSSNPKTEYIRIISNSQATSPIKISDLGLQGIGFDGTIVLPRAVELPILEGKNIAKDIFISHDDRVIISSGPSPVGYSFRVNSCSGYFAEKAVYTAALRQDCPDGSLCRTNSSKNLTYTSCVEKHKNDSNFYTSEWRVFLDQSSELWKNSDEIIKLVDEQGKIIDALTY